MAMDEATERLFRVIFQEAHVIDFDFSIWVTVYRSEVV